MFFRVSLAVLLLCTGSTSYGQTTDQQLIWTRYYNTLQVQDRLAIHTEIEERRFLSPLRAHQRLLPRVGIQYQLNETVSGNIGFAHMQFFRPQQPDLPGEMYTELRPHQYIEFDHYRGRLRFQQRFMTEQRFAQIQNDGTQFRFRLRLLNAVLIDFLQGFTNYDRSRVSLHLQNETMLHAGDGITHEYFDQTRFYVGIDSRWSRNWRIYMGGMLWLQEVPGSAVYYRRMIGRITLHHYFYLRHA